MLIELMYIIKYRQIMLQGSQRWDGPKKCRPSFFIKLLGNK